MSEKQLQTAKFMRILTTLQEIVDKYLEYPCYGDSIISMCLFCAIKDGRCSEALETEFWTGFLAVLEKEGLDIADFKSQFNLRRECSDGDPSKPFLSKDIGCSAGHSRWMVIWILDQIVK